MGEEARFLDVVDRLYGAVAGESSWQTALGALTAAFGASGMVFVVSRRDDMRPLFCRMSGIDPASWPEYAGYYHTHDIGMERALHLPQRSAVIGGEVLAREQLARSEWYNDFLLRYDLQEILAYLPEVGPSLIAVMTMFRPVGAEPFSKADKERLDGIGRHLDRVVKLRVKLAERDNALAAQSEAQDRLPFGVFLLDASARIARANRAGREMLSRRDGICVRRGRLGAAHREDAARLDLLIGEAVNFDPLAAPRTSGALALRRPSGKQPYSLMVMPLSRRRGAAELLGRASVSAIVFVTDPEARTELAEADLSCLFGLTPAEARLAARLATGEALSTAAAVLGVTAGTARNQLKAVMQKTDTHRQPELVGLLRSSVAGLAEHAADVRD